MTPFRTVIRKSFGSWTAEPNAVAHFPVVGAKKRTQRAGATTTTESRIQPATRSTRLRSASWRARREIATRPCDDGVASSVAAQIEDGRAATRRSAGSGLRAGRASGSATGRVGRRRASSARSGCPPGRGSRAAPGRREARRARPPTRSDVRAATASYAASKSSIVIPRWWRLGAWPLSSRKRWSCRSPTRSHCTGVAKIGVGDALHAEELHVEPRRLFEVVRGDADVIDPRCTHQGESHAFVAIGQVAGLALTTIGFTYELPPARVLRRQSSTRAPSPAPRAASGSHSPPSRSTSRRSRRSSTAPCSTACHAASR